MTPNSSKETSLHKLLKEYMFSFPDNFVGFFKTLAEILISLGFEWNEVDRKEWGAAFINCGEQCINIAESLAKIRDEFDGMKTR